MAPRRRAAGRLEAGMARSLFTDVGVTTEAEVGRKCHAHEAGHVRLVLAVAARAAPRVDAFEHPEVARVVEFFGAVRIELPELVAMAAETGVLLHARERF